MTRRFTIEFRPGVLDDILADQMVVMHGGALGFYEGGRLTSVYGPNCYLSATEADS